jgi:uncharacterized protein GlcG (DUF336 family)
MAGLTYEKAQNVLQAALRKADEIGVPSSVAVVDEGRELVAFARQTGALLASIEISISKAYTACSMQMDTGDLAAMTAPGQPLAGLETSHSRPLVAFAGGKPLFVGDQIAGAVGVAGGSSIRTTRWPLPPRRPSPKSDQEVEGCNSRARGRSLPGPLQTSGGKRRCSSRAKAPG